MENITPLKTNSQDIEKNTDILYEKGPFHDYFRIMPYKRLKKLLDRNKLSLDGKTILVASCGSGIDAYYLKKFYSLKRIYFSDVHEKAMVKTLSNFSSERFIFCDNLRISFKDNSFDFVFIAESLHHLKEPITAIYELLRLAKEGLIVIEPNDSWLTRLFEKLGLAHKYEVEHKNYVYRFSKRDIVKIASALFFKFDTNCFFSSRKVAKTGFTFLILKALNGLANFIFPSQGNQILFLITKSVSLPKCFNNTGSSQSYSYRRI